MFIFTFDTIAIVEKMTEINSTGIATQVAPNPIETLIDIASVVSSTRPKARVISKKTRQKFHAYDMNKNCRDFGKEHKYIDRGTYFKCTRCGSSRTKRPTKSKAN